MNFGNGVCDRNSQRPFGEQHVCLLTKEKFHFILLNMPRSYLSIPLPDAFFDFFKSSKEIKFILIPFTFLAALFCQQLLNSIPFTFVSMSRSTKSLTIVNSFFCSFSAVVSSAVPNPASFIAFSNARQFLMTGSTNMSISNVTRGEPYMAHATPPITRYLTLFLFKELYSLK